jgi:iron complex outermembrane receptor protein
MFRLACFRCAAPLAASLGLAVTGSAQTAPAPSPAATTHEDVVLLSPFEVSATTDTGYTAAASIGATRTRTLLIELPQNIQVFTDEFIKDVAATDTWETLRFASNATGGDRREDTSAGTGTSVRGYNVSRRVDGLEMPWAPTNVDPAAYERIELVKGSSSVLFGSTAPGGVINYITKKPQYRPATEVSLRVGSYDYFKAVFDHTGPLVKRDDFALAYRLIGTWQDSKAVRQFESREGHYLAGTIEALVRNSTTLRFRVEQQKLDRLDTIAAPYLWEPTPAVTNPPGGTPITAPGVVLNLPRSFARAEPTDYKDTEFFGYNFTGEHRFGANWAARAVVAYSDWNRDSNETVLLAQTNSFGTYTRRTQVRTSGADTLIVDLSVVGEFDLGPTRHQLLLGTSYIDAENYEYGGDLNVTPNFNVFAPVYGGARGPMQFSLRANLNDNTTRAWFVQDQIKLFEERLHLIVGLRRDDLKTTARNLLSGNVDNRAQGKTSPRYSVLWRARPDLSVYYAYNETFRPATNLRPDGTLFDPPTTEIHEVGAKYEFWDKRFVGSFAVFSAELGNQFRADPNNPGASQQTSFESKGAEIDFIARPLENWQLLLGFGYLDTEITKNEVTPAIVGNRLGSQPSFTAALWTKYDFTSGPLAGFSLGGGVNRQQGRWDSDNNRYRVPDYTIAKLLARYAWSRYSVSLNVENLFDRHYVAQSNSARFTIFGEPRRFFGTFTARF